MGSIVLLVALFAIMYLLMIRPQRKRAAERAAMLRTADVGDVVATVGGVIGKIVAVEDPNDGSEDVVCLEVDSDVELRVQRRAIGEILSSAAGDAVAEPIEPSAADEPDPS